MRLSIFWLFTFWLFTFHSTAQSYTEGPDLPGVGTGPAFTVAAPSITIAGQLSTPADGQDRYQITIPAGCSVTGVTYTMTDKFSLSVTGFAQFGIANQPAIPPLSGSFANGPTGPFPVVGPGTYNCMMVANIAFTDDWTMVYSTTCGALPVELLEFTATKLTEREVYVQWITGSEANSDYFAVQRSRDGLNFSTIRTVQAAGFSQHNIQYAITDTLPIDQATLFYYRLEQKDIDGSCQYSTLTSVTGSPSGDIRIVPNPPQTWFRVLTDKAITSIEIYTTTGQLVRTISGEAAVSPIETAGLQPSIYWLYLNFPTGERDVQTLVIR